MISKSLRGSVGGGGSSRIFPGSPRAYAVQWGGGVVAGFFRDLQLRNQIFTQH